MVDDQAARALHRRVRVLCWLPSTKARLEGALKAVNETWGRRCDGRVYFVNTGHTANDVVDVGGLDGYDHLSSKSAAALVEWSKVWGRLLSSRCHYQLTENREEDCC